MIALDSREPISGRYSSRFMTIASYAYMFKVRQIIVAFTLFDLNGSDSETLEPFSESRFLALQKSAREGLRKIGFKEENIIGFVPTSTSAGGLNILTSGNSQMPWFANQPCLVDLIQRCKPIVRNRDGPGILQIQKVIPVSVQPYGRRIILSGAVLRGSISVGQHIVGIPSMKYASIGSMEKFRVDVRTAYAGDTVGVALDGNYMFYQFRAFFSGFLVADTKEVRMMVQRLFHLARAHKPSNSLQFHKLALISWLTLSSSSPGWANARSLFSAALSP